MKRITILTASSGGGHNAAANALKEQISNHLQEECTFDVIDIYKDSFFKKLPMLACIRYYSDELWQLFINLSNRKWVTKILSKAMRPAMLRSIKPQLPKECDYLIAVHFNPAHCLHELSKEFPVKPKTAIVVTDFDPHWGWLGENADCIYTISETGLQKAKHVGYDKQQIHQLSLVPSQAIPHKKSVHLNKHETLKIGLVSGQDGSNSEQIKNIISVLRDLSSETPIELSVFCGKNTALKQALLAMQNQSMNFTLNVLGYTLNLSSKFYAFDLMIIRTSPGILSECVMAAVPVIGFEWSAHESYQQQFILENKIGTASRNSEEIRAYIRNLIKNPEHLEQLHSKVNELRKRQNNQSFMTHLLDERVA